MKTLSTTRRKFITAVAGVTLMASGAFNANLVNAASDEEPTVIVRSTVDELLNEFTSRRSEFEGNKQALYDMVDRVTKPHFDFAKISKLVLAQEWKTASDAQRKAFGEEFRTLLIRTYATALFQYTGEEKMTVSGSEIKERRGVKTAEVDSELKLSDGPPIPINYSMILTENESWKIYNMVIAGVNMVTSYRKTYGSSIRSLGLDGLIDSMRKANGSA